MMRRIFIALIRVARLVVRLMQIAVSLTASILLIVSDALRAIWSVRGGGLTCPAGHRIKTFGDFECSTCSWSWRGAIYRCPNPLCKAPTERINCQRCGRSVRSPARLGRP